MTREDLITAIDAALAGDWHRAHQIVQRDEADPLACWIHAVLHKIEGDDWNSRYWYRRTAHRYEDWRDPTAELRAARAEVSASGQPGTGRS
jgi:hypothetical protein